MNAALRLHSTTGLKGSPKLQCSAPCTQPHSRVSSPLSAVPNPKSHLPEFGGRLPDASQVPSLSASDAQRVSCTAGQLVLAEPETDIGTQLQETRTLREGDFKKASLYLLRTDGKSCTRELVSANSKLSFAYPSTQQHMMVWRNRPSRVMVLKKLGEDLTPHMMEVIRYLGVTENMQVIVEPHEYNMYFDGPDYAHVCTYTEEERRRLSDYVDFVVCLGGDGVLLHASYLFRRSIPPVISFNLGSLGFLTNHGYSEFHKAIHGVIYGTSRLETCSMEGNTADGGNALGVMITLRLRLQCAIWRRGAAEPEQVHEVLNEVVIDRGSSPFLTNVECYEKGRFISRVQADGVLLATPTGSTAYSVAAGGSMVHPNVPCILFTPICPHSLNFRPVILPDYAEIELRIPETARAPAWVCFDGKLRQELHFGDSVHVSMSQHPVPTINKTDLTGDWFDSLERCFNWSNRSQQKALD